MSDPHPGWVALRNGDRRRDTTPPRQVTALGTLVRRRRQELGLTQARLGELLGFDHSMVGRLESGHRQIHPQHVGAIARILQVPEADVALAICGLDPGTVREEIRAEFRAELLPALERLLADEP
jgi:transcriptional regulator with XRE-family HTH domain